MMTGMKYSSRTMKLAKALLAAAPVSHIMLRSTLSRGKTFGDLSNNFFLKLPSAKYLIIFFNDASICKE